MHDFERIFEAATAAIDPDYFFLPVSGREDPIYRERVYCYELYHQIRVRRPGDICHTLVTAKRSDVVKDLETLVAFIDHGGYQRGICLFYGYSSNGKGTEDGNIGNCRMGQGCAHRDLDACCSVRIGS